MSSFYRWRQRIAYALPLGELSRRNVNAASQPTECARSWGECIEMLHHRAETEEERREVAELERRLLASRAMGC
jgi:hypothetical protein